MAVAVITHEEFLKLAALSSLKLETHEVEPLRQSLAAVLNYASCLKDYAAQYPDVRTEELQTVPRLRDDTVCSSPASLVGCAAVYHENYFVVPLIIKQS